MRLPKRGERGFTLIELLIVVAILGVLAAVVIPNVSRFFGKGEEEARKTEKHNLQLAVGMMMQDNSLALIPNIVGSPTDDMAAFPDAISDTINGDKAIDPEGIDYLAADIIGYILYGHDINGGAGVEPLVNYMPMSTSSYQYRCAADGTVYQYDKDGSNLYGPDGVLGGGDDEETYPTGW